MNLESRKYILALGRFVPEKGFDYLIESYLISGLKENGIKLVIAGDADHESTYSKLLKQKAVENGVVLTGFIKGDPLRALFSNANLFVIPSFYEGLPITLLEAMSYQLKILASTIKANLEVELPASSYFEVGDKEMLVKKLRLALSDSSLEKSYNMERFNWNKIAKDTLAIYQTLV